MDDALAEYFDGFEGSLGAPDEAIAELETHFGRILPAELREILMEADGLGGVIGGHELSIWSCDQIVSFNDANQVQKYFPAFLLFGSDGGGETYTLDYRTNPPSVVLVAAMGFDYESAILIGRDFSSFLRRMTDPRSLFEK